MPIEPHLAHARRFLSAEGPPHFQSPQLASLENVRHGFFGREGGVSTGIYASLNAGPGSKDDSNAVAENRRRIAAAMRAAPERLLSLHQVHSAVAITVDAPWSGPRPEADALVTKTPGLALTALSADCAPILLADSEAGVIAAAHAGWKGALAGVTDAAIEAMVAAGARPAHIIAAIGPCIRQPSYEVGLEFEEKFLAADAANAAFFRPGPSGKPHFDLPAYVAARLTRFGVERIDSLAIDTYSDETALFSHRRSVHAGAPDYGRNCAAIALTA
ncbi:MAG: peptidoglycan editing factor PgeF [Hyphomonadaceae bacterium]